MPLEFKEKFKEDILKKNIFPVAVAALVDRLLLHPVDTITTVQQKQGINLVKAVKEIYRAYGLRGYYAGFFLPFLAAIPIRISIYSTYSIARDEFKANGINYRLGMLYAGILSGCIETLVMCPSDGYRTRLACGVTAPKLASLRVAYRGATPLLLRTTTENTIALAGSDLLRGCLPAEMRTKPWVTYVTGLFSGMLSQYIITPVDLVKTMMMSDPKRSSNLVQHIQAAVRQGSLFSSAPSKMLRMGVGNSVMLGTIEVVRNAIESLQPPAELESESRPTASKLG